jgi:hypothetical protein
MIENLKTASQMRPGERLLMKLHRHWIVFAFKIGYIIGLVITTIIIMAMKTALVSIFGTAIFW